MKSVVFRESLNLFSCKLAGPFVFQGKNKLKALPDFLLDLFAGLGPPFHLLQLFFGHQLAGFFMPGQAALLVFFSGTTWTRVISIGFGCSKGGGHRSLAARSLIGVHHFVELRSADAVFYANQVRISSLDQLIHRLEGIKHTFSQSAGVVFHSGSLSIWH